MCTVSMISQHYHDQYPNHTQFPPAFYPDFAELIRKARLYDEMTKQPDCPDPAKVKWQQDLERFMRERYGIEPK